MKSQAELQEIDIQCKFKGSDLILSMDKMRTIQILLNLISNALKFSGEYETVKIKNGYTEDKESPGKFLVVIEIRDKGIGITEAD